MHIDHIAIAVNSIDEAKKFYEDSLGLAISHTEEMASRGIKTAFIKLGDTMIELIEPLHSDSEVSKFLANKGPGIHHIALKTNDIKAVSHRLVKNNCQLIYDEPSKGAHDTKINFVHPKSSGGVLVEIIE